MQINNNLNSMMQFENRLDKSADAISKISLNSEQIDQQNKQTDLVKEMVKQIEIPIAYTANAEVISTQNDIHQTLLDIKA